MDSGHDLDAGTLPGSSTVCVLWQSVEVEVVVVVVVDGELPQPWRVKATKAMGNAVGRIVIAESEKDSLMDAANPSPTPLFCTRQELQLEKLLSEVS